jgi:hypothetical protein
MNRKQAGETENKSTDDYWSTAVVWISTTPTHSHSLLVQIQMLRRTENSFHRGGALVLLRCDRLSLRRLSPFLASLRLHAYMHTPFLCGQILRDVDKNNRIYDPR